MKTREHQRAHVVVLGAGYAGLLAALRVAGRARREGHVTLVNAQPNFVERIRLHQLAAGQTRRSRKLATMTRHTGIELVVERAVRIDVGARRVALASGAELTYDLLVYALGSGAPPARIEGAAAYAHSVANETSALRLRADFTRWPSSARALVIGGGLTAIELAAELAEARPDVRMLLACDGELAPGLSARGRRYVRDTLTSLGVELMEGAAVQAVGEGWALLRDGRTIQVEGAIDTTGFGVSQLARESGLPCTEGGRLLVDGTLRAPSAPTIFGAGDGVLIPGERAAFMRMSCASAMPLGAHAADNVLRVLRGEPEEPFGFGFAGQCISLGRRRGLLQLVAPDDAPLHTIATGFLGARLKEAICRYTTIALTLERLLPGTYTWPRRSAMPLRSLPEAPAPPRPS